MNQKAPTQSDIKALLRETLSAVERLVHLFRFERIIHLVAGLVALLMLLYGVVALLRTHDVTTSLLVSLFGSSGLIAVSSARITYYFDKAFSLIEHIIHSLTRSEGDHGGN